MEGRSFYHPARRREATRIVYGGEAGKMEDLGRASQGERPDGSPYALYWGEIHGHTALSDGQGSLEDYFRTARDIAKLDFCAATDHDHGGVGRPELWGAKWELTQEAVDAFHEEGRFVTLLGYERDSWPWYANLCLYFREGRAEMVRGEEDGEITRHELKALLGRDDVIAVPHHTGNVRQGVNFDQIPLELMTPLMEVYSKWGTSEYFGNPRPVRHEARNGQWRTALDRGARIGCVAGSDVHSPHPGLDHQAGGNLFYDEPGLVAVLARDLTRESIFDALKARRCYGASGARIALDFRMNGAHMGEAILVPFDDERRIYLRVEAPEPLDRVDLVKNGQDFLRFHFGRGERTHDYFFSDLQPERETDYYYVRVTLQNGRQAWSSPIWAAAA